MGAEGVLMAAGEHLSYSRREAAMAVARRMESALQELLQRSTEGETASQQVLEALVSNFKDFEETIDRLAEKPPALGRNVPNLLDQMLPILRKGTLVIGPDLDDEIRKEHDDKDETEKE